MNKMIPGTKKSVKGDLSNMDNGNPPNNFPEGEMINAPPPPIAPKPRKASRKIRIFRSDFVFIKICLNSENQSTNCDNKKCNVNFLVVFC